MKPKRDLGILNPFVFTKKTAFMQRVVDAVSRGYCTRYVMGQIPIEKAGFFAYKLNEHYSWSAGKVAAHRARQKKLATARLLFLYQNGWAQLTWILLVTDGDWQHPDAGREKWRDPTIDRVQLTGYELVRHIRTGKAVPSWTWAYEKNHYSEIREAIILAIRRGNDDQVKQWIHSLWRSPAYANVREQVKKIKALIQAEWKRSRGSDPMPEFPKGLGYVRRIPDKGKLLTVLVKEIKHATDEEGRHPDPERESAQGTA